MQEIGRPPPQRPAEAWRITERGGAAHRKSLRRDATLPQHLLRRCRMLQPVDADLHAGARIQRGGEAMNRLKHAARSLRQMRHDHRHADRSDRVTRTVPQWAVGHEMGCRHTGAPVHLVWRGQRMAARMGISSSARWRSTSKMSPGQSRSCSPTAIWVVPELVLRTTA